MVTDSLTHENALDEQTSLFIKAKKTVLQQERDDFNELMNKVSKKEGVLEASSLNEVADNIDKIIIEAEINRVAADYLNSKYDRTVAVLLKEGKLREVVKSSTIEAKRSVMTNKMFKLFLGS